MKRKIFISVTTVLLLLLSLFVTSCGGKGDNSDGGNTDNGADNTDSFYGLYLNSNSEEFGLEFTAEKIISVEFMTGPYTRQGNNITVQNGDRAVEFYCDGQKCVCYDRTLEKVGYGEEIEGVYLVNYEDGEYFSIEIDDSTVLFKEVEAVADYEVTEEEINIFSKGKTYTYSFYKGNNFIVYNRQIFIKDGYDSSVVDMDAVDAFLDRVEEENKSTLYGTYSMMMDTDADVEVKCSITFRKDGTLTSERYVKQGSEQVSNVYSGTYELTERDTIIINWGEGEPRESSITIESDYIIIDGDRMELDK